MPTLARLCQSGANTTTMVRTPMPTPTATSMIPSTFSDREITICSTSSGQALLRETSLEPHALPSGFQGARADDQDCDQCECRGEESRSEPAVYLVPESSLPARDEGDHETDHPF